MLGAAGSGPHACVPCLESMSPPGGDGEGVAVPTLPGTSCRILLMQTRFAEHVWLASPEGSGSSTAEGASVEHDVALCV